MINLSRSFYSHPQYKRFFMCTGNRPLIVWACVLHRQVSLYRRPPDPSHTCHSSRHTDRQTRRADVKRHRVNNLAIIYRGRPIMHHLVFASPFKGLPVYPRLVMISIVTTLSLFGFWRLQKHYPPISIANELVLIIGSESA